MIRKLLQLGLMCAAFAGISNATIIFQQISGPTSLGGGLYQYSYTAALPNGFNFRQNDFFTAYDVFQLVESGPNAPTFTPDPSLPGGTTFALTIQPVGLTPPSVSFADNPAIDNITIMLTSASTLTTAPNTDMPLGVLTFVSTTNIELLGDYTSQSQNRSNLTNDFQHGFVTLPSALPEPSSFLLLGGGMVSLVFASRRRKK